MSGMTGHLTAEILRDLYRGRLESDAVPDALRHLGACAECTVRARTELVIETESIESAFDEESEPEHLDEEEIVRYVDDRLSAVEREIDEAHLEDCAMCRVEVDDVIALRAAYRGRRNRIIRSVAAAAGATLFAALLLLRNPSPSAPQPTAVRRAPIVIGAAPQRPPPAPPAARTATAYENDAWARLVETATAARQLPWPRDLALLSAPSGALRGENDRASNRLEPAGIVIDEERPLFTWAPSGDATYTVSVFDGDVEVAHSAAIASPRWRPERALPRGRTYTWQVEVSRNGASDILPRPPQPLAVFRIATEESHREIRTALAQLPGDHLLHAILYARAGLERDAKRALQRAVAAGNTAAKQISASP